MYFLYILKVHRKKNMYIDKHLFNKYLFEYLLNEKTSL